MEKGCLEMLYWNLEVPIANYCGCFDQGKTASSRGESEKVIAGTRGNPDFALYSYQ